MGEGYGEKDDTRSWTSGAEQADLIFDERVMEGG